MFETSSEASNSKNCVPGKFLHDGTAPYAAICSALYLSTALVKHGDIFCCCPTIVGDMEKISQIKNR